MESSLVYFTKLITINVIILQNCEYFSCTVFEIPTEDSLEVDSYYDLRVADVLLNSNLVTPTL